MNNALEIVESGGIALIKELFRLIPVLGGTAVEIYNEFQSKQVERKIQRLDGFYRSFSESLQTIADKINDEYVSKEDFLDVFEEATRYVVLERQERKRLMFKNILTNSITSSECDFDKTERYFRLLDYLSELELTILAVLENPERYNSINGMIIPDPIHNPFQTFWNDVTAEGVMTQLLHINIHDLEGAISVLLSNGLVSQDFKTKRLHTNSNPIHVLDHLLTVRGKDFVKYLMDI